MGILKKYLNRYAAFDALVIAGAVAFGIFTGKLVYTERCADTAAALSRLLPTAEAALDALLRDQAATEDTLDMLPGPPTVPALQETDDR